jgi:hypothetical protein
MNKNFIINPTVEFHILRHFENVDEAYGQKLIGKEYFYYDYNENVMRKSVITRKHIKQAFKTRGSKFNHTILKNSKDILLEIQKRSELKNWLNDGSEKLCFEIEYTKVVGSVRMQREIDLSLEDKEKIVAMPRSQLEGENNIGIKYLDKTFPDDSTFTVGVEIIYTSQLDFLWISAYPVQKPNFILDDNLKFYDQVIFTS